MNETEPSPEDVAELISFLPQLEAPGFAPISAWRGGEKNADGEYTTCWPEYDEVVERFFVAAAKPCWIDRRYLDADPSENIRRPGYIESADLAQIKSLLTFCVRGERFCDGHWGGVIEAGHVQRIVRRPSYTPYWSPKISCPFLKRAFILPILHRDHSLTTAAAEPRHISMP